jgi:outer membrane lipoprotein SlyB
MRNLSCVSGCAFASLRDLMSEHFYMILAAMAVGAFFGATFGGIMETLAGAGIGLLVAVVYGYIPRMIDCVDECPIQ